MGEISAASTEQSSGVAQVGEAMTQMDRATQQNAALVEQSAAAAESLKDQAQKLVGAVAVFKLAGGHPKSVAVAPERASIKAPVRKPSGKSFPAVERRSAGGSSRGAALSSGLDAPEVATLAQPAATRRSDARDGWDAF
jgi:methyl-accepting chemotaxis protein